MTVTIAVGLEATIDVWVTFPSLDDLGRFARRYGGRLAEHVRRGYEAIAAGRGDEVSIDGRARDARRLVRQAREFGADIRRSLGGNGAQEAATLEAIGANAVFLGAVPSSLIAGLPPESREHFERADLSFAYVTEHRPASYILQAPMTNRFILCEGTGRRIEQLRPYLQGLPAVLERVADRYGRLDMVNLVGWHVLFANGIDDRDLRMIRNMIEDIRNAIGSPIFTDAGGLAAFDQRERRLLCKIYSLCDVLSVNEDEVLQVSRAMGASAEDEFRAMHDILTSLERVSTVWLHALEYQASLSTAYGRHALEGAQVAAASAGACRVERGSYPTLREIEERARIGNYSEKGLEAAKRAEERYGAKIGNARLVVTPCYKARGFASTVGAGDVAAATYTYWLSKGGGPSP